MMKIEYRKKRVYLLAPIEQATGYYVTCVTTAVRFRVDWHGDTVVCHESLRRKQYGEGVVSRKCAYFLLFLCRLASEMPVVRKLSGRLKRKRIICEWGIGTLVLKIALLLFLVLLTC